MHLLCATRAAARFEARSGGGCRVVCGRPPSQPAADTSIVLRRHSLLRTVSSLEELYPLGIIHGGLGLTIAASLPDRWLHHMRVGIGYLRFH